MRPGSHAPSTAHDDADTASRNGGCTELAAKPAAQLLADGMEVAIHGPDHLPDVVLDLLADALISGYFERNAGHEENAA